MEQKSVHKFIYKIESKQLKKSNWTLNMPLNVAMRNYPEIIVSLNDSQCLRFIDEINGVSDISEKVRAIQRKIKNIKKQPKSKENKKLISTYYDTLYNLQFQRDYVCVIMNSNKDYDRANNGFSINFGIVDGKECVVHYRRFLGTNGGIKNSTIVYVNEEIYPELKRRLDNGRDMSKELVPAKLEAYQALICSGSVPLPEPKGIIVVKDCITHFKEDVIMINDETDGEPILTYEDDYEFEHNDSDGYGLMLPSYSRKVNEFLTGDGEHTISGMNTRYAWNKGMVYTFDYIEFAEKVAGTYEIVDAWGDKQDIRNAEVILTVSMLKLWDSYKSWEDYYENCQKNHYQFSTPKTTPDVLENVRDTNYQFLQSYEFTDDEVKELCQPTIDEIKDVVGLDYRKSLAFLLGFGLNEDNVFNDDTETYIKALMVEPDLINDQFIRKKIYSMIRKRIEMGERGAIRIEANFAMISGDPYALAQSMFGLEITGLLKAGEVYHKYWIDKGSDEIACFRAPMTCHNNIRKMKLCKSDEVNHWYQYITTALIYNAWDSACDAMNGADKDGDTNMCTDNPVILRNTKNLKTIVCVQRAAKKVIPSEQDIIIANKLAFNDDIGIVTNHITSMFEIQSGYDKDSEEYKTLEYRIMCGQLYQQNTIDRAKGIIAKSMPEYWYNLRDNKIKEGDTEEEIRKKVLNTKIAAAVKPYFMTYVYQRLKSRTKKYLTDNNKDIVRKFFEYGIYSIDDLIKYEPKTKEMEDYISYYFASMPTGNNDCVVNRISRLFEKEFTGYLSSSASKARGFDYNKLKTGVEYSKKDYVAIEKLFQEYSKAMKKMAIENWSQNQNDDNFIFEKAAKTEIFKKQCYEICGSEDELCDIFVDLSLKSETAKKYAWDMIGEIFVENLLNKNGRLISYPVVSDNGCFEYAGIKFDMETKKIEGDNL